MEEIKNNMEELKKLLHDYQEEHAALEKNGKDNSEALLKMGAKIEELSTAHQKAVMDLESEKKAREELELAFARGPVGSSDGEIKSSPEYIRSFSDYLRYNKSINDDVINQEFKSMLNLSGNYIPEEKIAGLKAMLVGSNPDGGYFVPTERLSRMIKRLFETSPMRSIATTITTSTEAVEMILDDGEFAVQTPAEMDARTATATSKIGLITIPVHEHAAMPLVTQKLLDDAIVNIEQFVQDKVADKFARQENWEFVNGSSNKECQGILSLADWAALGAYERNKLETRTTSTALAIVADDLLDLQSDLLEGYQANATWTMHRKIWVEVMKLKDLNGQYLLNPAMLFQGTMQMQLLGRPVVMFGDMTDTIDEDEYIICYGDFREGYMIVDRIGIRILRDPYTVKGSVQFYTTKRTGGGVVNFQAIKRLKVLGS